MPVFPRYTVITASVLLVLLFWMKVDMKGSRHIMTLSKHNSESKLKNYVSKAWEKKTRKFPCFIRIHTEYTQETAEVNKSTSSDKNNLESADFLEIGSQELHDMVKSVFEESTTLLCLAHLTFRGPIACVNKESGCSEYSFSNCNLLLKWL